MDLAGGAGHLGISIPALSEIERGIVFPKPWMILRIEARTRGAVTIMDHWLAWVAAHPDEVSQSRAAGRPAAKSNPSPTKRRK